MKEAFMIRSLAILTVFIILIAGFAPAASAQSQIFLKGDDKGAAKPIFNVPPSATSRPLEKKSTGSLYLKEDKGIRKAPSKDMMAQLMEENRQADYEIIKNESLKTKRKIMERRAAREAAKQVAQQAEAAVQPGAAGVEEADDNVKKVYVGKDEGGVSAPKKVFKGYD